VESRHADLPKMTNPAGKPSAHRRLLVVAAVTAATLLASAGTAAAGAAGAASSACPTTFPGDPGAGRVLLGVAGTQVAGHELATGRKLAHRIYFNKGISDFAVPNGPIARAILAEQAAGRIPVVSAKPGIAATATGRYDAQLRTFFTWADALPKVTFVIVHHEPENDAVGKPAAVRHQLAADFRAAQQHVRAALTAATGGSPQHVSFGGSLMTYTLTPQGAARLAPIDEFFPGRGVWDWAAWDQYDPNPARPLEDQKWKDALAKSRQWGVRPAVTELGVRPEDPQGASKVQSFYTHAVAANVAFVLYFDSPADKGWVMTGRTRDTWRALMTSPGTALTPNR
jgi:hypothetical protein